MLVLNRAVNQSIKIGDDITIVVVSVKGNRVRIGVDAPQYVPVHRQEIFDAIEQQRKEGDDDHQGR